MSPQIIPYVNEEATFSVTIIFYDQNRKTIIPDSIEWCIIDWSNGEVILDWQILDLENLTIIVPSEINAIEVGGKMRSIERAITIRAVSDERVIPDEYRFRIKKLRGISKTRR